MAKEIYYGQKSEIAFSFKTISDGSIAPQITTTDASLASWYSSDGQSVLNNNTGALTFVDATEKTITVIVDAKAVDRIDGFRGIALTYLNFRRLTNLDSDIDLGFAFDLESFFPPIAVNKASVIHAYFNKLDVLDMSQWIIKDGIVDLSNSPVLYKYLQPQLFWSASKFVLTKSLIYDTLDLSNGYFKGQLSIVDSDFIEGISFNPSITFKLVTSMNLSSNRILGYINFGGMSGLLTPDNSVLNVNNIGASTAQIDLMLQELNNVMPSGPVGRSANFANNSIPSASGLVYKAQLEAKGLSVIVDS